MKTINTKSLLVGALIAAGFSTTHALAGDDLFTTLDVNQDGVIDVQEAASHELLSSSFATLDSDQNGLLTKEEFAVLEK